MRNDHMQIILYNKDIYGWLFIFITKEVNYGYLTAGHFDNETDVKLTIDDIPLRKNLDEYVKILLTGTKLGLL